jgi:hypothetical protein
MGFRTYSAGLNQFLSRDMYNGALADMALTTDPFTGNRYTFAAGNPISNIELDGHMFPGGGGAARSIPLGFANESSFIDFSAALRNGLSQAGYKTPSPSSKEARHWH